MKVAAIFILDELRIGDLRLSATYTSWKKQSFKRGKHIWMNEGVPRAEGWCALPNPVTKLEKSHLDHVTDSQLGHLGIDLQAEWVLVILKELGGRELEPRGLTPSSGYPPLLSSPHVDPYYEEGGGRPRWVRLLIVLPGEHVRLGMHVQHPADEFLFTISNIN